MSRGRKRTYQSDAERQAAYRQRRAEASEPLAQAALNFVTQGATEPEIVVALNSAPPIQPNANVAPVEQIVPHADVIPAGTLCRHSETTGLVVRVKHALERNRVLATVVQAGAGNLTPGHDYPFRLVYLSEVTG